MKKELGQQVSGVSRVSNCSKNIFNICFYESINEIKKRLGQQVSRVSRLSN